MKERKERAYIYLYDIISCMYVYSMPATPYAMHREREYTEEPAVTNTKHTTRKTRGVENGPLWKQITTPSVSDA